MNSLKEVYGALVESDQVKTAEEGSTEFDEELVKQAEEYYQVGAILADHVFTDLVKEAVDEAMGGAPEEEKKEQLQEILAKARGEAPKEKKKEGEGEEGEKKPMPPEEEEKKASLKAAILEKMAEDPEYVSALIAKHYQG